MVNVKIFNSLSTVDWDTAIHTYGNDHSTLIGLLVQWWIKLSPNDNFALDGGPTCGKDNKGKRGGQCDALLCTGTSASGILEVEGTRAEKTIDKLGYFFDARKPVFETLNFAIMLLYDYSRADKDEYRDYQEQVTPEVRKKLSKISTKYSDKMIILISLEKRLDRQRAEVRNLNQYYHGTPAFIEGFLYFNGECSESRYFYRSKKYEPYGRKIVFPKR